MMSSKELMSLDVLINSKDMLLKVEKEKELRRSVGTCNAIILKTEYAIIYWSCSFIKIQFYQRIRVLIIISIVIVCFYFIYCKE